MIGKDTQSNNTSNSKNSKKGAPSTKAKWIIISVITLLIFIILFGVYMDYDDRTKYACNKHGISYARSTYLPVFIIVIDQNELFNLEKCPKLTVIHLEGSDWDSFTIHDGTFNTVLEMDISSTKHSFPVIL